MGDFDAFTTAYIETAFWLAVDGAGESVGWTFSLNDLAPEALESILEDCADFQVLAGELVSDHPAIAGRDFYLTRNRHGAGFWDGDWPHDVGRRLTELSRPYGTFGLYVGDDWKLHACG